MNFKNTQFFSWIFLLLFSSVILSCFFMPTPKNEGGNKDSGGSTKAHPWEKYPEADHSWLKLGYRVAITSTDGSKTTIQYPYGSSQDNPPLIFAPKTGQFSYLYEPGTTSMNSIIQVTYNIDKSKVDVSQPIHVYNYLDGKLIDDEQQVKYIANSDYWEIKVVADSDPRDILYTGVTWYFLLVFKGKDGATYKNTTPTMKAQDAA